METTKDIENLMRQAVLYPDNPLFASTRTVIRHCALYWETHDHLKRDNKSKMFAYLYLNAENFSRSENQKSKDLRLGEKTLERYRADFAKIFLFYRKRMAEGKLAQLPESFDPLQINNG